LAQNPNIDPRDIAKHFVNAYYHVYKRDNDFTHSAIDLEAFPALVEEVNLTARWFEAFLRESYARQVRDVLRWCGHPRYCTHFENANYIDLSHFCNNCLRRTAELPLQPEGAKQAMHTYLNGIKTQLSNCIIANVKGSKYAHACGLSIYLPVRAIDPTYPHLIWSQKTRWYPFLRQLFSVRYDQGMDDFAHFVSTPTNAVVPELFGMGNQDIMAS